MTIGMLWQDSNEFRQAISNAARHYEQKYGAKPTLCFVNPAMLQEDVKIGNVTVKADKTIMKGCYWLGVEYG